MTDLSKLRIEWGDLLKLGGVLAAVFMMWANLNRDISLIQADLKRIQEHEIVSLRRQDDEFRIQLARVRDEASAERLRQTELLTEMRADVRLLKENIARLLAGSSSRP